MLRSTRTNPPPSVAKNAALPLHRLLAFIAFHSHWFGCLIKGLPEVIIEDGNFVLGTMRRNHISTHDVEEDMRLNLRTDDVSKVKKGRVERSGDVSFICK